MTASVPALAPSRAAARDLRRLRVLASVQAGLSYAAIGFQPDPSAKAPCTRTMFLAGSARAGATAADRSATAAAAAAMGLFRIGLSFTIKPAQPAAFAARTIKCATSFGLDR